MSETQSPSVPASVSASETGPESEPQICVERFFGGEWPWRDRKQREYVENTRRGEETAPYLRSGGRARCPHRATDGKAMPLREVKPEGLPSHSLRTTLACLKFPTTGTRHGSVPSAFPEAGPGENTGRKGSVRSIDNLAEFALPRGNAR